MSERRTSGISDTAAVGGHDLIHDAEVEEQRLHPHDSQTEDPNEQMRSTGLGQTAPTGQPSSTGTKKEGMLDKMKHAFKK